MASCRLGRPLGQVSCVGQTGVVVAELRVRRSDLALVPPALARAGAARVLRHGRVGHEAIARALVLDDDGRQVVLHHGHARVVGRLDDVVVLDRSKVQQRLLLDRLSRRLLLGLLGLHGRLVAIANAPATRTARLLSMLVHLLLVVLRRVTTTTVHAAFGVWLLYEGGSLVN